MASALDGINEEATQISQELLGSTQTTGSGGGADPITPEERPDNPLNPTVEETKEDLRDAYGNIAKEAEENMPQYDPNKTNELLEQAGSFKKGSSYIDEATGTVAGQLETLLASDSPYIKQAEQSAAEQSQSRGMLNSSLAMQSGREAAISQALPIAQQDAKAYTEAGKAEQLADYGAQTSEYEAVLSSAVNEHSSAIKNRFTALMKGADQESQVMLADLQARYQKDMALFDNVLQERIMDKEIDARKKQTAYESASAIMQNYQVTVENMMTNPDFLALGAEQIANSINQFQNLALNQINFIGNSVGIDFTDYTEFYFDDIFTVGDFEDEDNLEEHNIG